MSDPLIPPNDRQCKTTADLPTFVAALRKLGSETDSRAFAKRWSVRRTDPNFWSFSDSLHERFAREQPLDAGVLDYNRLENRWAECCPSCQTLEALPTSESSMPLQACECPLVQTVPVMWWTALGRQEPVGQLDWRRDT